MSVKNTLDKILAVATADTSRLHKNNPGLVHKMKLK